MNVDLPVLARARVLALLALTVAAAGGCTGGAVRFAELPRVQARRAAPPPPLPYRVAVAPVHIELDAARSTVREDGLREVPFAARELQRALEGMLEDEGVFEDVVRLELAPEDRLVWPGGAGPAIAEAYGRGADLLVRLRVRSHRAGFAGLNTGLYLLNWLNWGFTWFLAWVVPDERWAAVLEADLELIAVRSEAVVHRSRLEARVEESLDDFDRGLAPPYMVYLPVGMGEENDVQAAVTLAPSLRNQVLLTALDELDGPVRERAEAGGLSEGARAIAALSVGVARYHDYDLHNLRFARRDALAFADALTRGGGAPPKNVAVLLDEAAGADAIRAEVEALVERAGPEVQLVLYFAGYGTAVPDGEGRSSAALVPYDYDGKTGGPLVRLREDIVLPLAAAVRAGRAASAVVVLDAGVDAGPGGRGLGPRPGASAASDLAALSGGVDGVAVLAAGIRAQELAEAGQGLFTHHLLRAMAGAVRRGPVSWREAFDFASREVARHAALIGDPQRPSASGAVEEEPRLSLPEPSGEGRAREEGPG